MSLLVVNDVIYDLNIVVFARSQVLLLQVLLYYLMIAFRLLYFGAVETRIIYLLLITQLALH